MKFKTILLQLTISFIVVICSLPIFTAASTAYASDNIFSHKLENRKKIGKTAFLNSNGKNENQIHSFIQLKNKVISLHQVLLNLKPKTKFFKGLIKTDNYKMNPQDNLSFSNTQEIIQQKFLFNVKVDMKQKFIHGFLRIFFKCNKKTKFFILDFKALQIFKVLNNNGKNLNFWFIKNMKVSNALGKGLKIELDRVCEINKENENNEKEFVDVYYATTRKSVALHFSDKTMLEDKRFGFMYSHGAAIFARTLFPCQDSPFAKVGIEAKIRIEQPYTMLFAGELVSKRDLAGDCSAAAVAEAAAATVMNNNNVKLLDIKKVIETIKSIKAKNNEALNLLNQSNEQNKEKLKAKISFLEKALKTKSSEDSSASAYSKSLNMSEFHFKNEKQISTYLITFAAGVLSKREFGDKCLVYGEKQILSSKKTTASFNDCSQFVDFYDQKVHKNQWGKMIFLIIPDDFPYAGMENPYNIHVARSVLTDDGSLRSVIAHEIAHFWSGNLVTNSNWEHFWLNEGFTNYLYRKCFQKLFGEEEFMKELEKSQQRLKAFLAKEAYLEKMRLQQRKKNEAALAASKNRNKNSSKKPTGKNICNNKNKIILIKQKIKKLKIKVINKTKADSDDEDNDNFDVVKNKDKSHLSLWPRIRGTDPYNNFSLIPYEKGFSFLYFIETKFGEKFVFDLLRAYFSKFKFASATTTDFINLLKQRVIQEKGEAQKAQLFKELKLPEWIHGTKSIPATFKIKSKLLNDLKSFSKKVANFAISKEAAFAALIKYNTYYRNYVLSQIGSYYVKTTEKNVAKYESTVNYLINRLFELEQKGLLEDSTKAKLIVMKATLMHDKGKKKDFLIRSLREFKFYHISYLKRILSILKFDVGINNVQILKVIGKVQQRFNKLAVLRLKQFLYKK